MTDSLSQPHQAHRTAPLGQSRRARSHALEQMRALLVIIQRDGTIVDVNEATCEQLGYTRDQLCGRDWFLHCVPATQREKARTIHRQYMDGVRTITPYQQERIKSYDGREFLIGWQDAPWGKDGKQVDGIIRIGRELHEESHDALNELSRTWFEQSTDAMFVWLSQRVIISNQACTSFFSPSFAEEISSLTALLDLFPERERVKIRSLLASFRNTQQSTARYTGKLRHEEKETPRHVEVSIHSIDFQEQPALLWSFRDITKRHQLEEQLRHAAKMEAIGRLAGGIAHDFNNLMTVVAGNAELVGTLLPPTHQKLREELRDILHAVHNAARLTKQLLAFGRKQDFDFEIVNLNRIVRKLQTILDRALGVDINLQLQLDDELGHIRVDPSQLEQVLFNLVLNARDAIAQDRDKGTVTIETCSLEKKPHLAPPSLNLSDMHIMLSVRDTGNGIPEEQRSRIFDPFFTTKPVGEGYGLGLSIVHGIIKQSGGHIDVHSESGRGSEFRLYFPVVNGPESRDKGGLLLDERKATGHQTIMVVEDEESIRKLIVRTLSRNGYHVLEASDGEKAYQLCQTLEQPVDLLLTDVVMPNMNGPQLVSILRQDWKRLNVLYISGYSRDAFTHNGLHQEGVHYLSKPFRPAQLLDKMNTIFHGVS